MATTKRYKLNFTLADGSTKSVECDIPLGGVTGLDIDNTEEYLNGDIVLRHGFTNDGNIIDFDSHLAYVDNTKTSKGTIYNALNITGWQAPATSGNTRLVMVRIPANSYSGSVEITIKNVDEVSAALSTPSTDYECSAIKLGDDVVKVTATIQKPVNTPTRIPVIVTYSTVEYTCDTIDECLNWLYTLSYTWYNVTIDGSDCDFWTSLLIPSHYKTKPAWEQLYVEQKDTLNSYPATGTIHKNSTDYNIIGIKFIKTGLLIYYWNPTSSSISNQVITYDAIASNGNIITISKIF